MRNSLLGKLFGVMIVASYLCGCMSDGDSERRLDRAALLELHSQQEAAHLTYDPELLVSMLHEPVVQINRGSIFRRGRQENTERIKSYFDRVEFLEWSNIDPPEINISDDGTMAYVVVHKRVRLTYEDEAGERQEEHTVFAWLEAWEKINGRWELMAGASTDRPGED